MRRPTLSRRWWGPALVLAVAAPILLTGCRSGAVVVTFRPEVGQTYRYRVEVRSESETRIGSGVPEIREEEVTLTAEHTVLESSQQGVRVQVVLAEEGEAPRTFVVVFDRAAQLEMVESIEGVADQALGDIGIAEIFPAAAGAPPDRPLRPGARWTIDDIVDLPGNGSGSRLTGKGRLVELEVVGGTEVARLTSSSELPANTEVSSPRGNLRLDGGQSTDYDATLDLDDGAVRRATSTTEGTFDLQLLPPEGQAGEAVPGTLEVRVSSQTRRLGEETLSRQPGQGR